MEGVGVLLHLGGWGWVVAECSTNNCLGGCAGAELGHCGGGSVLDSTKVGLGDCARAELRDCAGAGGCARGGLEDSAGTALGD